MNELDEIVFRINCIYKKLGELKSFINSNNIHQEVINLYGDYLKLLVQIEPMIPSLEKDYKLRDGNCYFYALGLPMPVAFKNLYEKNSKYRFHLNVGAISGERVYKLTERNLLESLYNDLAFLNIKYYESTINAPIEHGGYKISLFMDEKYPDYHFVRQNSNGIWSQKKGYNNRAIYSSYSPLDYLNVGNGYKHFEYVKTIEIVKPTLKRIKS